MTHFQDIEIKLEVQEEDEEETDTEDCGEFSTEDCNRDFGELSTPQTPLNFQQHSEKHWAYTETNDSSKNFSK